jgi:hypothetical protein
VLEISNMLILPPGILILPVDSFEFYKQELKWLINNNFISLCIAFVI